MFQHFSNWVSTQLYTIALANDTSIIVQLVALPLSPAWQKRPCLVEFANALGKVPLHVYLVEFANEITAYSITCLICRRISCQCSSEYQRHARSEGLMEFVNLLNNSWRIENFASFWLQFPEDVLSISSYLKTCWANHQQVHQIIMLDTESADTAEPEVKCHLRAEPWFTLQSPLAPHNGTCSRA